MERHEVIDLMRELKLLGMKAADDEVLSNALKRQHPARQIIGNLLQAEIAEKQARSIRYQVAAKAGGGQYSMLFDGQPAKPVLHRVALEHACLLRSEVTRTTPLRQGESTDKEDCSTVLAVTRPR